MNAFLPTRPVWLLLLTLLLPAGGARGDTHIFAGAVGTNLNDALLFTNGRLFETNSGYRLPMVLRTNGLNAGYHRGDVLTFTALSATDLGTGQVLGRALLGSRLAVEVVSVDGPPGGGFAFWEGDQENPGNAVTFSLPVGTTGATNSLVISEGDGSPGSDPYGHIHGRAFTATLPGLYTVGFRLVDVSTNGPGGGPMHSPSAVLPIWFQAGPVIERVQHTATGTTVFFRSAPGVTNVLEATDDLGLAVWTTLPGLVRGNSARQSLVDTNSVMSAGPDFRAYRLRLLNLPP